MHEELPGLSGRVERVLTLLLVVAVVGAGAFLLPRNSAVGDESPLPSPPPLLQRDDDVVTSDPIPTVQIDNGYVWAQDTIGTTVYAVGDFDNAREPLAAPGTELTARSNVLAYDIETGALLPFAPQVNGVVKAVAASPDGSRIYIGGSFTSVNGQARWNIAALDATTGELLSTFKPAIGGTGVYALVAAGSTVYAGGLFTQGNGTARKNLAAFSASNGALMPWAPETDLQVDAMVADPGGAKIIVGGRFSRVNGDTSMRGAAALDRSTGAVDTGWALVQTVKNGATTGKAGIFSLAVDDSAVYGTGWVYADASIGNLEGTFSAEADTGDVRWIADCLGDHYGVYSTGSTVYTTSHTHACSTMGLHPEQNPREHRYAEAYTADVRGTLGRNPHAGGTYKNWEGTPAPSAYAWYPDFYVGNTTGMGQAGLSITGVGDTISIAGEFKGVNQGRFEGIVRFSTDPPGGPSDGPRLSGSAWQPTTTSAVPGRVRVSFPANWDRDDLTLTYELRRTGSSTPVATLSKDSTWWNRPTVVLEDTTAAAGTTPTYTVVARDGDGNTRTSASVSATVAAGTAAEYTGAVLDDGATLYYPLGTSMQDWAGGTSAVPGSGVTAGTPGIENSATGHSALDGSSSGRISSNSRVAVGESFSTELWFRTTSTRGGKLMGYGDAASGSSGSYDRHLYMRNDGRIVFGVYPGEVRTVESTQSYSDGGWHHAVATLDRTGQKLYVDGELIASEASTTSAQAYSGYWRIGGDNLSGWPGQPSSAYFVGSVDEVAVYPHALTPAQVSSHFALGSGLEAPTAEFTEDVDGAEVTVDGSGSSAQGGAEIVEYRWDFGDGSAQVTGREASHTYETTGDYTITLTVRDSNGLLDSTTREVSVLGPNTPPVAAFSAETNGLSVTVDGSGSDDPDGELASYSWDWGDGTTSTGLTSAHTYSEAGEHTVTLTVTDDRGATAEATRTVTATHADPVVQFDTTVGGLDVTADAGASTASDGATLEYSWDWGDGSPSTDGVVGTHSYAEEGVYEITLSVTDSLGGTAETTSSVTVSAEALAASDTFSRTVSSGWGAADSGGTWTPVGGSAAVASVDGAVGRLALTPGSGRSMVLPSTSLSQSSTDLTYTLEGGPATGAVYVGSEARYGNGTSYRTLAWHRADGTAWLLIQRNGTIVASKAGIPGTWAAGSSFRLRAEVTGDDQPTVRMKVWSADSAEPSGWQLETTDESAGALTAAGASSVYAYRAGSGSGAAPITIDDYLLRDLSGTEEPAVNEAPTAAFTSGVSGLTANLDGSGSSDSDGSISSYAWELGDGSTASGALVDHTYAEAGTYTVTLTVTDDDGATHSTSEDVTVTEDVRAASDAFERTAASGWGAADIGGAWQVTGGSAGVARVTDGSGELALPAGSGRSMVLPSTDLTDSTSSVAYTLTGAPSTGALYVGIESRYDGRSVYRSAVWHRADGSIWLLVQRNGAVIASQPLTGRSWNAGDTFRVKTDVIGDDSTTVRVKLWNEGTVEPTSWQLETTDAAADAVTTPGRAGLYAYRAGSGSGQAPIRFDEFVVQEPSPPQAMASTARAAEEPPTSSDGRDDSDDPADADADRESDHAPAGTGSPAEEPARPTDSDRGAPDGPETEDPSTDEEPSAPRPTDESDAEKDAEPEDAVEGEPADEDASEPSDDPDSEQEGESSDDQDSAPAEDEESPEPEESEDEDPLPFGDDFERPDATGWARGAEDHAWTLTGLAEASQHIEDGAGILALEPGADGTAMLEDTDVLDGVLEMQFSVEDGADPADRQVGVVARATGAGSYRVLARVDEDGTTSLVALSDDEVLAVEELDGVRLEAGAEYSLQVSVEGTSPTTLSAKLWDRAEGEPKDWQLEVTDDSTPSQSGGMVGIAAGLDETAGAATEVRIESFEVTSPA